MTNEIIGLALVTVVSTNWVNFSGDVKREGGTNYVRQQQVIQTNVYVQEVMLCTNRTLYKTEHGTNGPIRWEPLAPMIPPPLPGQFTKP